MTKKMKYNFREKDDLTNGKPVNEIVIQKHGHIVEFTLSDVETHMETLNKVKKEIEAKIMVDGTQIKTLVLEHPELLGMSDEQIKLIHAYWSLLTGLKPYEEKLNEIDAELGRYDEELAEIKSQIPQLHE